MTNKVRKLVIIKPKQHLIGEQLDEDTRAKLYSDCEKIKKNLNNGKSMIFAQNTKCAVETAYIAHGILDSHMLVLEDVLCTAEAHHPKPKNLKNIIKFLNIHQQEFDNLILVTHIGDRLSAPIFSSFFLNEYLGWDTPCSTFVGEHEILEYRPAA